jgi:hypothetical protein
MEAQLAGSTLQADVIGKRRIVVLLFGKLMNRVESVGFVGHAFALRLRIMLS